MPRSAKRAHSAPNPSVPAPIDAAIEEQAAKTLVRRLGIAGYLRYLRDHDTGGEPYQRLRDRWRHGSFEATLQSVKSASRRSRSRTAS